MLLFGLFILSVNYFYGKICSVYGRKANAQVLDWGRTAGWFFVLVGVIVSVVH